MAKMDILPPLLITFKEEDKKSRPGIFFIVSGPSGVGKNTLLNYVLKKIKGIYYLPSVTTRPKRKGEMQGREYYFVTKDVFEELIRKGLLLEWKKIHTGDYYGTHFPTINYALKNNYDLITDMDVLGCAEVVQRLDKRTVTIFIQPPDMEELKKRLYQREKDDKAVKKRLERVDMEMSYVSAYDHVIVNDDLEKGGEELLRILRSY